MQVWKDYQQQHQERYLNEMLELLRIPSISAKSEHKADMLKCAEAVRKNLLDSGCTKAEVMVLAFRSSVFLTMITCPTP